MSIRPFLLAMATLACLGPPRGMAGDEWDSARFDRQIAPLLARHCLECHNPSDRKGGLDLTSRGGALEGGEAGAALEPGDAEASYAFQRIDAGEMPPQGSLADDERELLRHWIDAGAVWGADPIDRFRFTTDKRAGYDWWALQALDRPDPPAVEDATWPAGEIDHFILSRLEAAGLRPSPMASKAVLIRRLSFDLTGLPPSPEEVAAFEADADPQAYQRLVERLLASPRYGERWARHWLDVARFAESNGFEYDEPRRSAWPYRDWVIEALNADLPYDEFCRLQIAGDVLEPDDPRAVTASAFLTAGPYDTPGQKQQSAAMRAVVRQDEMEELVGTVSQTFLALTLNCARCHDHKFDPIRQTDYYRFVSALAGVRHGERDLTTAADRDLEKQRIAAARAEVERLTAAIEAIDEPVRRRLAADRHAADPGTRPAPIARWVFDDGSQDFGQWSLSLHDTASLADKALVLGGAPGYAASAPLDRDLKAKTLQAWVRLDDLAQPGAGVMTVQSLDGQTFDAIVFAEQEPGRWLAGSNFFERTQSFAGPQEKVAGEHAVRITITYADDGTIAAYRNGEPYGQPYKSSGPAHFAAGQAQVVFGLRHSPPGGNKHLRGAILRAELFDRALTAEEVAAAGSEIATSEIVAALDAETAAQRRELAGQLTAAREAVKERPPQTVYACKPQQPEPTRLLKRGDPRLEADVVAPGGIASAAAGSDFGLAPDAPEGERRAALARWITAPDNALFARTIVNRVWHYHFGAGLVDTPNDFGFNGGRPSHPELLDWLAGEFVARGYRLKELHRLIVTSSAYRQASAARDEALDVDRGNRLLWRRSPQRLEAEALRDAILHVSGRLRHAGGGPGFRDYEELNRAGTWSYLPADLSGPEVERRTIFRTNTRGGRGGLLDAFDCPDPSTTTPRRAVTTTPLQALALLNNAFVLRMSEAFAERIAADAGEEPEAQVRRAFALAFSRAPSADEVAAAADLVRDHGLATLARVIFNSNEFLYVD